VLQNDIILISQRYCKIFDSTKFSSIFFFDALPYYKSSTHELLLVGGEGVIYYILLFSDTTHREPKAVKVAVCRVYTAVVLEVQVVCELGVDRMRRSRQKIQLEQTLLFNEIVYVCPILYSCRQC
jgi:hypothetical protein